MDLKSIKALLEKYYNGETTLEEEAELKFFFKSGHIPDNLKAEKIKFQYYDNALKESTDRGLDQKLALRYAPRTTFLLTRIKTVSSIAAGLLLLSGALFFLNRDTISKNKNIYGTYNNPQVAYNQTKKALLLISNKLNKGNSSLSRISEFNEMQVLLTRKK